MRDPISLPPVQVTLALLLLMYVLWSRFGREEDPERQALLEEIRQRLAIGEGLAEDEYGDGRVQPIRG